jgi:hypothetical protein
VHQVKRQLPFLVGLQLLLIQSIYRPLRQGLSLDREELSPPVARTTQERQMPSSGRAIGIKESHENCPWSAEEPYVFG